jgi:type I restriction enzyme S subunit
LKKNIHREFVAYVLTSRQFQEHIQRCATGSTIKNVSLKMMREFKFRMPEDEKDQIRAVESLKYIDEKIRINRQTNQTLEEMAQTLFKSWFVDFDPVFDNALAAGSNVSDFPEALQQRALLRQERRKQVQQLAASPKTKSKPLPEDIRSLFPSEFEQTDESSIGIAGWIPKGWKATSFESIIKLIGGGTPKTTIEEYWSGEIPWFSVVDAPNDSDVFVLDTEKHVTQLGVDKSSTKILRKGTTIISARGKVGKCALVSEPMAMNQSCYGLNGIEGVSDEFIYFMTRHQVSDLQKRGHGSVFNTITRETFKSIILPFSGSDITQKFSKSVVPFLNKILLNNKQNVALEKTRDVLLPKLISGELTIPDTIKTENIVNHQQPKEPLSHHA